MSENLVQRVVSALLLLPPVLGAIYFGGWWFAALLMLGGTLMVLEWCGLTGVGSPGLKGLASLVIVAGVMALMLVPGINIALVLAGLAAVAAVGVAALRGNIGSKAGWWFAGLAYVAMPIASLWWVRETDGMLLFWIFLVVWATDVGGYFAGKSIGGPKLAPKISPKKTWAGLLGGMALSMLVSYILHIWFETGQNGTFFVLSSGLLAFWAQMGDLLESAVKRHFGVKDSGGLIPGHGGLLDRVDGLVFVAPAVVVIMLVHTRMGLAL